MFTRKVCLLSDSSCKRLVLHMLTDVCFANIMERIKPRTSHVAPAPAVPPGPVLSEWPQVWPNADTPHHNSVMLNVECRSIKHYVDRSFVARHIITLNFRTPQVFLHGTWAGKWARGQVSGHVYTGTPTPGKSDSSGSCETATRL